MTNIVINAEKTNWDINNNFQKRKFAMAIERHFEAKRRADIRRLFQVENRISILSGHRMFN